MRMRENPNLKSMPTMTTMMTMMMVTVTMMKMKMMMTPRQMIGIVEDNVREWDDNDVVDGHVKHSSFIFMMCIHKIVSSYFYF